MKPLYILSFFSVLLINCQEKTNLKQQTTVWENFVESKKKGKTPILPDFSFAGYKYSEVPLPTVNYKTFNVTNFGANPNDTISDKEAIKKAIAAAQKHGEGIIYFPKGKYYINTGNDDNSIITISSSKIVFRGENEANTTLFFDRDLPPAHPEKLWTCPSAIKVTSNKKDDFLTKIISNSKRETFTIHVKDASKIKQGDWLIIQVKNNSKDLINYDIAPLVPDKEWTAILAQGVQVNERHQVASVKGNKITLVSPIHYDIAAKHNWQVYSFAHVNHVGFEHLTFEGNWTKEFVHHRSAQDDGGWSILSITKSVNSWVKNCTFKNVNRVLTFSSSAACTALNITINGAIGHSAVNTSGSTHVLLAKINDVAGMHHTTGVGGGSNTGTVIWRSKHPSHTSFEAHASQPRATLFDNVEGGFFQGRAGGARFNLPNHGRHLVLWNYKETDSAETDFRFVATDTWYWRIVPPIIVGFHGTGTTFKKDEVQILESLGTPVKPESLFEEQLKLRLGKLPKWLDEINN
ncbi:DUF4955 domain-containing protein [Seonamhaeicola algicola]|uniref:DUF4955 domain-containing protein n=1 Tax=Seonamhaeicola algicola TaxID=1719036 RepID=A0A5C7AFL3_9FLAO|nr:DUF4955 domain-containing protein [Seonamhaeicola algicola]TXE06293.1 DUF4955 domain-containing protein [Seonamhaeicola algicola]